MYNAAATIDRTLDSIRAQTLCDIEILVIDDGSSDGGTAIVDRHRLADARVKLVRQENQGVAAARNHGARLARSEWLSFIDADDLWAKGKLARQFERLQSDPQDAGVVYSWFARIDANDRITSYASESIEEGNVIKALCARNIIGNGSAIMVRRALFEKVGGFDVELQRLKAHGCEDYDLYARLAGVTPFALVRSFDIGYRITNDNMSSDLARMVRSRVICSKRLIERYPDYASIVRYGRRRFMRWSARRAVQQRRWRDLRSIAGIMATIDPLANLWDLPGLILRASQTRHIARRIEADRGNIRFKIGDPFDQWPTADQQARSA